MRALPVLAFSRSDSRLFLAIPSSYCKMKPGPFSVSLFLFFYLSFLTLSALFRPWIRDCGRNLVRSNSRGSEGWSRWCLSKDHWSIQIFHFSAQPHSLTAQGTRFLRLLFVQIDPIQVLTTLVTALHAGIGGTRLMTFSAHVCRCARLPSLV